MDRQGQESYTAATVYYDGSCPVCRAEISYFQSRTATEDLRFEDVSRANAQLPDGLTPQAAMARFHVRGRDGHLRSGAEGFVEMWAHAPGWKSVARLSRLPGFVWLLERLYRGFLHIRPVLVRILGPFLRRRGALDS